MSKCISRHGEYSEHTYPAHAAGADRFVCKLCAAIGEDDILAALDRVEAERDALAATVQRVRELVDRWNRISDSERVAADKWAGYHAGARSARMKCEDDTRAALDDPQEQS